jgi:hypothetical protein
MIRKTKSDVGIVCDATEPEGMNDKQARYWNETPVAAALCVHLGSAILPGGTGSDVNESSSGQYCTIIGKAVTPGTETGAYSNSKRSSE